MGPSAQRKLEKQLSQNTFELVAMEWHARQSAKWSPSYTDATLGRMRRNLFPFIGSTPVNAITAPELLALLRKVEARGTIGTAHAPTEQIRGIYNRSEYLPERRRMLQDWADFFDELRAKARQEVGLE